jgi:hypothetical protein
LLMVSTYELNILTAYIGISIFRRMANIYNKDMKLLAAASMFVAEQLVYDVEHIDPSGWIQILGIGNSDAKKLQDLTTHIPIELKGQLRSKSLYDYAVSKEEALYGLYYLCSCVDFSPEELHSEYLKYETYTQLQNRESKNMRMDSVKLRTGTTISLLNIQNTNEFKLLGPMLSYICITEPADFREEMALTRSYDVKSSSIDEIMNASKTIQKYI